MNMRHDPLDDALKALPRSVEPARDLWTGVRADIEASAVRKAQASPRLTSRWLQVAAGVTLIIASSLTTYVMTRRALQGEAPRLVEREAQAPLLAAMPASFGGQALGVEYIDARGALDTQFAQRVAALPPAVREKLERDIAQLRHAADEISQTLAQHPSDPLLQELLMSTYQSELQLFADVNALTERSLRTHL